MVTHSMENILSTQYFSPASSEALHSQQPSRKKRCLAKEQDPMSHRIIEKRRRDRMNNCLADLSRLIPAEYLKKGRGRVEKTEIIEMAIRHMKYLQSVRQDSKHHAPVSSVVHAVHAEDSVDSVIHPSAAGSSAAEHYRLGYQECLSETIHFLVDVDGFFSGETVCVQLINHLQQHCDKILAASDRLGFPHPVDLPMTNGGSPCGGIGSFSHANGGIPSMCPTNNITGNGLNLLGNSNNHNGSMLGNGVNSNHHQQHPLLHSHNNNNNNNSSNHNHNLNHNHNNNNSDRCSSSGVSSLDSNESRPQRPLVPPPTLVSDDSDHSNHSHASSSMTMPGSMGQHQQEQRPPPNYKFKNSIKQRFSADQRIKSSVSPPPVLPCGGEASPRYGHQGVPIFALHDNGGFYIPLTVEASTLRPYLGYQAPDLAPEAVLHPVTISVNFNHSSVPTWSPHSPPHQIH